MKFCSIHFNLKIFLEITLFLLLFFIIIISIFSHSTIHMNRQNYTSILRDSHERISQYIGKRITTSGYIFRAKDFSNKQFVSARDMFVSENETNIVGFLCQYDFAEELENNIWVEATGTIQLGDYYGPIPFILIDSIHPITTPNDIYVSPPKY